MQMHITCNIHNWSIGKAALATPRAEAKYLESHGRPSWRSSLVANIRHVERRIFDEWLQTA
jgi:hypothetical protein